MSCKKSPLVDCTFILYFYGTWQCLLLKVICNVSQKWSCIYWWFRNVWKANKGNLYKAMCLQNNASPNLRKLPQQDHFHFFYIMASQLCEDFVITVICLADFSQVLADQGFFLGTETEMWWLCTCSIPNVTTWSKLSKFLMIVNIGGFVQDNLACKLLFLHTTINNGSNLMLVIMIRQITWT